MFLLSLLSPVFAELPLPPYPQCGEVDRNDLCPADYDGDWWLSSYIPAGSRSTVREAERNLGSGCAADLAWRTTTGRFDVIVVLADTGIDWADNDYQRNVALNTDELPLPQLADGSESPTYDVDGNGLVNISDYAADPRVSKSAGVERADGMLDASDLIYSFSDGVDDDGNGFVDDIAGWDFFQNDNDAYTSYFEGFGDHGGGVAEDMVSEGGADTSGSIGVCPGCSLLPLRIADSIVSDGGRVAQAMVYAADRGASAMSMATGAINSPDYLQTAVAYAESKGVVMVGAAGDENAYHHNFPSVLDGVLYVHSVTAPADENNGAYSYFNIWNCNNWGPRLQLVAASSACATGAVAVTTASAGLIRAAGRDNGIELSAQEIYQLLAQTADDVWLTEEEIKTADTYPSAEGWDPYFGYGRVNVGRAVARVIAGEIPPTATISSPSWFQVIDPGVGTVDVTGTVAARSGSYTWKLELGTGEDPRSWEEVGSGSGTEAFSGSLATVDISGLPAEMVPDAERAETVLGKVSRVFAPAVTLRLSITDGDGVKGEFRKTFFVQEDPDRVEGFPLKLSGSAESSPNLADIDGDGILEIVMADSSGFVHVLDGSGVEFPGWPVRSDATRFPRTGQAGDSIGTLYDRFLGSVAIGDLDGDGSSEVVVPSTEGKVYAWHSDGSPVAGFPVIMVGRTPEETGPADDWDNGFMGGAALEDLDGDGSLEIVVGGMDQRLYVWDHTGQNWGPYPIELCSPELCGRDGSRIINTPAIGDIDGDGALDIAIGTNEAVKDGKASITYVLDANSGTLLDGWPVEEIGLVNTAALLPIVGEGHPASVALADLDGDGTLELANPIMLGTTDLTRYDGTKYLDVSYVGSDYGADSNTTEPSFAQMNTQPVFGDLSGDGVPDYVQGGTGALYLVTLAIKNYGDFQHVVGAWDGKTGEALRGWPRQIEDLQFLVSPAVADLSGDGKAEAILGSAGYLVHAWDAEGKQPEGWPKFTGNWILGSAAVGDLDGDGYVEVVVSTREGYLWAWHTKGRADQNLQWASMNHDPRNTRNFETPLDPQAGPPGGPDDLDKNCGCGGDSKGEAALLLLPLLALGRRRRG